MLIYSKLHEKNHVITYTNTDEPRLSKFCNYPDMPL